MAYKRKRISVAVDEIGIYDCSLEDMIGTLRAIQEKFSDHEDLQIQFIQFIEDEMMGSQFIVYGKRLENDKEFNRRVKALEKEKKGKKELAAKKKEEERETYEKLKKKFGKGG